MDPKEAIKRIERNICNHMDWCGIRDCAKCEVGLSIEALSKQIPKKPSQDSIGLYYFPTCPNCFKEIENFEHHCECGQTLDMEEVE